MAGKGDKRRPENGKAIEANWALIHWGKKKHKDRPTQKALREQATENPD